MINHTSKIGKVFLVDTLRSLGLNIVKIYAPEHGFRGELEAGEYFSDQVDSKTGIPVISLYGSKLKPTDQDIDSIDIVLFDIQDVGVRFYTYSSSMQYMMEACARRKIPFIVLDRPNPNGYYIDGPVLRSRFASFVGLNPIPLVHGLTLGEYATMINGEGWLGKGLKCDIRVITVNNYKHDDLYQLPVAPSPNLPNMASVYLYPSLGLFEGTKVSVGRGTDYPFQLLGYPGMPGAIDSFMPVPKPGYCLFPPYNQQLCHGYNVKEFGENYLRDHGMIYLFWLTETYASYPEKKHFFTSYFNTLAGNASLKRKIKRGKTIEMIRETWKVGLEEYKIIRKKYLLYPDFK